MCIFFFTRFLFSDETQVKYAHAAICLNKQCSNPVSIPWKEDCPLVRKPEKKSGNESNSDSQTTENSEEKSEQINEVSNNIENNKDDMDAVHCHECGTKYSEKHIDVFVKTMDFTHVHLQNMERASVACILLQKKYIMLSLF